MSGRVGCYTSSIVKTEFLKPCFLTRVSSGSCPQREQSSFDISPLDPRFSHCFRANESDRINLPNHCITIPLQQQHPTTTMNVGARMTTTTMARSLACISARSYSATARVSGIAAWSPSMGYHKIVTAKPVNFCYVHPRRFRFSYFPLLKRVWKKGLWM